MKYNSFKYQKDKVSLIINSEFNKQLEVVKQFLNIFKKL